VGDIGQNSNRLPHDFSSKIMLWGMAAKLLTAIPAQGSCVLNVVSSQYFLENISGD